MNFFNSDHIILIFSSLLLLFFSVYLIAKRNLSLGILGIILFIIFYSDFIVSGFSVVDNNKFAFSFDVITLYNLFILGGFIFVFFLVNIYSIKKRNSSFISNQNILLPSIIKSYLRLPRSYLWLGLSLFFFSLIIKLNSSGWDLSSFIDFLIGPRFDRPWRSYISSSLLGTVSSFLPYIDIFSAWSLYFAAKTNFYVSSAILWIFFVSSLFQTFADGSRTNLLVSLSIPILVELFSSLYKKRLVRFYIILSSTLFLVILLFSLLYQYRSVGIADLPLTIEIIYHQDDNAIQFMRVISNRLSFGSSFQVDFIPLLLASFLNFIPRTIWPEKPFLDQFYWGEVKFQWVTISAPGELVASLGMAFGFLAFILLLIFLRYLLAFAQNLLFKHSMALTFIAIAFYSYMCIRSIQNISMYVYFPLFSFLLDSYIHGYSLLRLRSKSR